MAERGQEASLPCITVGYAAQVVLTEAQPPAPADLRTVWPQSRGSWRHHPVFQGLPVHEVLGWLRGEDRDVEPQPGLQPLHLPPDR